MTNSQRVHIGGFHTVKAILKRSPERIIGICLLKGRSDMRLEEVLQLIEQYHISVQYFHRDALDKLLPDSGHQGIIAVCRPQSMQDESFLEDMLEQEDCTYFFLLLDGVKDPGNLGACLRNADAAGIDAVIIPRDRAAGLTAIVEKVASGAAQTVPLIAVSNLARAIDKLKQHGVWVYGLSDQAKQSIYKIDLSGSLALVLGAEEKGLRRLTGDLCDGLLSIPMQGTLSSLNVSAATAVCLFEAVRQRELAAAE